jgi:hypothetical protein
MSVSMDTDLDTDTDMDTDTPTDIDIDMYMDMNRELLYLNEKCMLAFVLNSSRKKVLNSHGIYLATRGIISFLIFFYILRYVFFKRIE